MLRIPHCLDSRLTDGGEVLSPEHRPRSTPGRLKVVISARDLVDLKATVQLVDVLAKLKNSLTSSGIEPTTLQFAAQCLSQLCYRLFPVDRDTSIRGLALKGISSNRDVTATREVTRVHEEQIARPRPNCGSRVACGCLNRQ
jgi:hypothetical protein